MLSLVSRLMLFRPRRLVAPAPRQVKHPAVPVVPDQRKRNKELLARVVSDGLLRSGVLSHQHKFKMLALDRSGRANIVLVEIASAVGEISESQRWQCEMWIRQSASLIHSIDVFAVYWRKERDPGLLGRPSGASRDNPNLSETHYADLGP